MKYMSCVNLGHGHVLGFVSRRAEPLRGRCEWAVCRRGGVSGPGDRRPASDLRPLQVLLHPQTGAEARGPAEGVWWGGPTVLPVWPEAVRSAEPCEELEVLTEAAFSVRAP